MRSCGPASRPFSCWQRCWLIFATHDAAGSGRIRPQAKYFVIDGNNTPRPIIPIDSPILDETQLLGMDCALGARTLQCQLSRLPAAAERRRSALYPERLEQLRWKLYLERKLRGAEERSVLLCFAQAQRSAVIRKTSLVGGHLLMKYSSRSSKPARTSISKPRRTL